MHKATCNCRDCFLCTHSRPEWRELIALNKRTETFRKGQTVFAEGDPVSGIYFIYSGAVKVHKRWIRPKELIIRFASEGNIIGHRGLNQEDRYPVSATALSEVTTCFVPSAFLEASLQANPTLTYQLMQVYARELQKAEKRLQDLVQMDVKGRIVSALLEVRSFFGTDGNGYIRQSLSRQEVAAFAGTTYETLFRFFQELTSRGLVATSGKFIRVPDPERLAHFTEPVIA